MVGQRVVVRHLLPGEVGPSGGPAATDVLGVCTAWQDATVTVRREDGSLVTIPVAQIVSGKPVPPRRSVRQRVGAREAQVRALAMWPALETAPLGDWTLRWSAVDTARRANSALAMGPAGVPDAVERVVAHYAALGRRPIACVEPDSAEDELFRSHGWDLEAPQPDSLFQLAGVAAVRRGLAGRPAYDVRLEGSGDHVRATIDDPSGGRASGVAAYAADWVGLRSLEVDPAHRRQGRALAVVAALLEWGAERGAGTAYLQVTSDNAPAVALYARIGFVTHHTYRYLAPTPAG